MDDMAVRTLHKIYDLLYLEIGEAGNYYNPDKSWDADTLDNIRELVNPLFDLLPVQRKDNTWTTELVYLPWPRRLLDITVRAAEDLLDELSAQYEAWNSGDQSSWKGPVPGTVRRLQDIVRACQGMVKKERADDGR